MCVNSVEENRPGRLCGDEGLCLVRLWDQRGATHHAKHLGRHVQHLMIETQTRVFIKSYMIDVKTVGKMKRLEAFSQNDTI